MVLVLDCVIARRGSPATLADIVRQTSLPRATAHAIVAELTDAGWLARRADGTIAVGDRFLSSARTALGDDPLVARARPAMRRLVDETGAVAFLARRVGDAVEIVEYAAPEGTENPADRGWAGPGRRLSLRPPICREFVAWSPADVRDAWIDSAPLADRPRLRTVLDEIARRGYSIERITDDHRTVIDALSDLDSVPASLRAAVTGLLGELSAIDYLPDELADDAEVGAVTVGAPVTDPDGAVIGAIVSCPHTTMRGRELKTWGEQTVAAAHAASAS